MRGFGGRRSSGSGFLYGISRLGVTGARDDGGVGAEALVAADSRAHDAAGGARLRHLAPEHVAEVGAYADAAVVGSALVALIAEASGSPAAGRTRRSLRPSAEERVRAPRGHDYTMSTLTNSGGTSTGRRSAGAAAERAGALRLRDRAAEEGQGVEIYQPDREKEVLNHVRAVASEGPLGPDAIARLFERIIDEARRLERRVVHGDADVTA